MRKLWLIGIAVLSVMAVVGCGSGETDAGTKPDAGTKSSDTPNLPDKPTPAPTE